MPFKVKGLHVWFDLCVKDTIRWLLFLSLLIFKSNDAIWQHESGTTEAQILDCYRTAPSHYLNKCWLIVMKSSDNHLGAISQEIPKPSITKISLNITYLKFHWNIPGTNALMFTFRHVNYFIAQARLVISLNQILYTLYCAAPKKVHKGIDFTYRLGNDYLIWYVREM